MADVITRFKVESSEYERKIKSATGLMDGFKGSVEKLSRVLGVNMSALTKMGTALGAVSAAMKVAKDAFMQCESNIDEWGRTIESAKGAYDIFLQTINNGNWNSFFANLSSAVQGARDLYDALDRLGSVKANNQSAIAIRQQELAQLRLKQQEAQTKKDKDQLAQINSLIKQKTQELRALQSQETNAGKRAGRQQIGEVIRNGYNSNAGANPLMGKTVDWATNQILQKGQAFFDSQKKLYYTLGQKASVAVTRYGQGGTKYTSYEADMSRLSPSERRQYWLAKTITERETALQQGNSVYAQAVNQETGEARQEYKYNRYALKGISGSGGSGGATTSKHVIDLTLHNKFFTEDELADMLANDMKRSPSSSMNLDIQGVEDMFGYKSEDVGFTDADWDNEAFRDRMKQIEEGGKVARESWKDAANAIGSVGSALQQINDPAAKIFGIIAEAIANVASGFASALSKPGSTGGGVWGWIAAAAAGTATMISTIAAIKTATAGTYANGGVIGGSSFSGDNLQANVNSGELILNKAQQGNLASQLNGTGMQSMQLSATIKGEDIRLALNNNSRRRGKGEYVTSRG